MVNFPMTKILDATCSQNNVTVENRILADCEIFSEGKALSSGVVLIEEEKTYYITSNASDIKTTITTASDIILKVTNCFTALDALPTIAGACASFTAQLLIIKAQLDLLTDTLK